MVYECLPVCICVCIPCASSARGGQKRSLDLLRTGLSQMWVPDSPEDLWAISLTPNLLFFINLWASDLLFHMVWAGKSPFYFYLHVFCFFFKFKCQWCLFQESHHTNPTTHMLLATLKWDIFQSLCDLYIQLLEHMCPAVPGPRPGVSLRPSSQSQRMFPGSAVRLHWDEWALQMPLEYLVQLSHCTEIRGPQKGVHLDWKLPIKRVTEQGRSVASWLLYNAGQSVLNPCHCQCLKLEGISHFRCIH